MGAVQENQTTSLSRGLLVIVKSELLAAHEPSPRQRLQGHSHADGLGFPGAP